jgi:hypothetical protein
MRTRIIVFWVLFQHRAQGNQSELFLRYCRSREYAQATDSKPVRNLAAEALKPLAEAILAEPPIGSRPMALKCW